MKILINGQLIDISHLAPVVRQITLDLRGGKQKKNARLEISFSNHCYSRRPGDGEKIPPGMLICDGSSQVPRNRIFCSIRYEHSLSLLKKIDSLILDNGNVRRSRNHNFFSTTSVIQASNGGVVTVEYYIFIGAKKLQDKGMPPKLALFIESAYPESEEIPSPKGEGDFVPLSKMLGRYWENK